jgi:hypothetical protein
VSWLTLPQILHRLADGSAVLQVAVDAPRMRDLERLVDAVRRRHALDDDIIVDEIFALGLQAAWLRLSANEPLTGVPHAVR